MSERTYTRDEVEAIMRVALERADAVEGLTRDELVEVAADVGIPAADLDAAVELIEREREVAEKSAEIKASRKRRFARSLGNMAIIGGTVAGIDYMLGPDWYVQYLAAAWGMVLAFQARSAYFTAPDEVEKLARKKLEREWRKREWRRREREFPKAVEAGASALIEAAARKIAERLDGTSSKSGGPRVRVETSGSRPSPRGAPAEHEVEVEAQRQKRR